MITYADDYLLLLMILYLRYLFYLILWFGCTEKSNHRKCSQKNASCSLMLLKRKQKNIRILLAKEVTSNDLSNALWKGPSINCYSLKPK